MADELRYDCITRRSCMENTSKYGLKRWDAADRIRREEFNDNWDKIDTALGSHAGILAHSGNCKVVFGTYTGDGTYGAANPRTLTFDGTPVLVVIQPKVYKAGNCDRLLLIRGTDWGYTADNDHANYRCNVTWGNQSVSWSAVSKPLGGANGEGIVYCYAALIAAN